MNSQGTSRPQELAANTKGFVLAAAVAVLFNTALAWAKDAWAPLNRFMASLTGHHWTTHGLADLLVFAVLGLVLSRSGLAEKMPSARLPGVLAVSVTVAAVGLALWFTFV